MKSILIASIFCIGMTSTLFGMNTEQREELFELKKKKVELKEKKYMLEVALLVFKNRPPEKETKRAAEIVLYNAYGDLVSYTTYTSKK